MRGPDDPGFAWDNRQLCRDCFTSEFQAEFGDLALNPRETIRVGFLEAVVRGLGSAVFVNSLFALTLFGIFLLIQFAAQLSNLGAGKPISPPHLKTWGIFLGIAWCFVGIVVLPMIFGYSLTSRSRTISVSERHLVFESAFQTLKIPFEKCIWYDCPRGGEGGRLLFWLRPILGAQDAGDGRQALVCGYTERTRRMWTGYFSRELGKQQPGIKIDAVLWTLGTSLMAGGTLGALLGGVVHIATGNPRWITSLTLLGFLDGILFGLIVGLVKSTFVSKCRSKTGEIETALSIGCLVGAAKLGFFAGFANGFPGAIVCAVCNLPVGFIVWQVIRPRIEELKAETSASPPLR